MAATATFDEVIEGKIVVHDGIECRLERSRLSVSTDAVPTKKGRKTAKYLEEKAKLGDDWSFSFDVLPDDVVEQLMQYPDVKAYCDTL